MEQKKQTLKDLFADDPEMLRVIELREQNALLRELAGKKTSLEGIEQIKGAKGDMPKKGKDYFTPNEVKSVADFVKEHVKDEVRPVKGKDYFTREEIHQFLEYITPKKGVHYNDGIDGIDGKHGVDGRHGVDGLNGKNGQDGIDGEDGEDAVFDEKELFDSFIKRIKKEQPLDISHIKNASTFMKDGIKYKIEELMHGSGSSAGGGTTLKVEVPVGTVDGMNTVFTVSNTPVYIEASGQIMVSSAQDPTNYGYTLAGLTITFVNAPYQTPHSFYNS